MTTFKLISFGAYLMSFAMLSACGETRQQLAAAQALSCTELAREIGKREQRRDSAQIDGVFNTIESVIADDKEDRDSASIASTINIIDETDAEESIEQLERIYRSKGCT